MNLGWFENSPVFIFIDNSCLVAEKFNLTTKKMLTLKTAISRGDFLIITTEICKGEFLKHSSHTLAAEIEKVESLGLLNNFSSEKLTALIAESKCFSSGQLWDKFIKDFNVRDISMEVSWREVFYDFFNLRPPFSDKKRSEFPDAFNLKMIEKLNPKYLIVISSDPDFDEWAKDKQNVKLYKRLQEFTDEYVRVKDPKFVEKADVALAAVLAEISDSIKADYSSNDCFEITSYHSDIENAEITDINLLKSQITSIDTGNGIATYRLIFTGTADLEISSSVVVYDSIDKEDITLGHNSNSGTTEFTAYADVTFNFSKDGAFVYEIEDIDFNPESFEVPHEWESFIEE